MLLVLDHGLVLWPQAETALARGNVGSWHHHRRGLIMVSQGNQGEVQVFPEGWVFLFCGRLLADALKQPGVNRPPDNNRVRLFDHSSC